MSARESWREAWAGEGRSGKVRQTCERRESKQKRMRVEVKDRAKAS